MLDAIPVGGGRNGGGGGGGSVFESGLEQMEESLSEGNRQSLLLLWSSSTRGKYQSKSSSAWHQPSMMLVPLAFWQMTLCLVKVMLKPASHREAMPMRVLGKSSMT